MAGRIAKLFDFWWVAWLLSVTMFVVGMGSSDMHRGMQFHKTRADLRRIDEALAAYRTKQGDYPPEPPGLKALLPDHVSRISSDTWGNPYVYRLAREGFRPFVYSIGVDGIDAFGLGDDVISSAKKYRCQDYELFCGPTIPDLLASAGELLFMISTLIGVVRGSSCAVRKLRADPFC